MDRLTVSPAFQAMWAKFGFSTVAEAVARFLPKYQQRRKVTVLPVALHEGAERIDAFFKLYHHREGGWRFWLRASKSQIEFRNYETFQRLGVPAAEPIAFCEERDLFGRLHRDFILTRAVTGAQGFDEFFRQHPSRRDREPLAIQLAEMLRRLHSAKFFYHDLVWRNILVSVEDGSAAKLFLIDCPRGGVSRLFTRRQLFRDLASLDKTASQLCSRTERLRFFLHYAGEEKLTNETRRMVRACLEYRRTRWPEDWRGGRSGSVSQ
jgi:tRNA A-37 threonylcarbamoyl transferase component Bud32